MRKKGTGNPLSKAEITSYRALRRAGVPPKSAAETIGRSKSTAYRLEKEFKERLEAIPPVRQHRGPKADIGTGAGFVMLVERASHDREAAELVLKWLEEYGPALAIHVATVAIYLATLRAVDLQREYGDELLEGEVFQAGDVLETIEDVMLNYRNDCWVEGVRAPEIDHENYREWLWPGEAGSNGPLPPHITALRDQVRNGERAARASGAKPVEV